MPRLRHSPILGATGRTPNPDDREDDELSELDDDLDLGDPAAGTSYGRGGKEPDDSHEPATKGELREFVSEIRKMNTSIRAEFNEMNPSIRAEFNERHASIRAEFDRKLEEKFADIISIIERNKTSTKRSPTSPKPVDPGSDDSPPVSLRLGLRRPISRVLPRAPTPESTPRAEEPLPPLRTSRAPSFNEKEEGLPPSPKQKERSEPPLPPQPP